MDIAQIRTFLAAAESGSFAKAADIVHASSSSVTERIAALEARLNARLFDRSRSGCVLTHAGLRFLSRARDIDSLWEASLHEVGFAEPFDELVRIGGQYMLWPQFLMPWIPSLQTEFPRMALVLTAGASQRLNRELASGSIDFAILYDPLLLPDISAVPILNDRLVLATGAADDDWASSYVDIHWGSSMNAQIASALGRESKTGLSLDLGGSALRWLIDRKAAGYIPERLALSGAGLGKVRIVANTPMFDYPTYALWRRNGRVDISCILHSLQDYVLHAESLRTVPS